MILKQFKNLLLFNNVITLLTSENCIEKQEYRLLMHVFNKNKLVYKINYKIAKSVAK